MWLNGNLTVDGIEYEYWIKVYEEPSSFGINNGRISKLSLYRGKVEVASYDRGWDRRAKDPTDKKALKQILNDKN